MNAIHAVGQRLKDIRIRQGRTLQQIADQAGFSKSLLSKIEGGKTMPPLSTLMRIAATLGVGVDTILQEADSCVPAFSAAKDIGADAFVHTEAGYSFCALAGKRLHRRMDPCLIVVHRSKPAQMDLSHAGEEWIFVLEGRVRYRVGARIFEMGQGDSLYFDAVEPHGPEALTEEARYLLVHENPASYEVNQ